MHATPVMKTAAGGQTSVRRLVRVTGVLLAAMIAAAPVTAREDHHISVREDRGSYHVDATFEVPQTAALVYAVLTDYEQVPKFMPDVKSSIVRERTPERILLEQEAVAKLMFFSKRVHLLLAVYETPNAIRFTDTGHKSFTAYDGVWTLTAHEDRTHIAYGLTAKPSFSVPEFVLMRLLKRDAGRMINGLKAEMAKRSR
jgi:ribosome-associated toxin RatA of RatAB toxin-antitoxin module